MNEVEVLRDIRATLEHIEGDYSDWQKDRPFDEATFLKDIDMVLHHHTPHDRGYCDGQRRLWEDPE